MTDINKSVTVIPCMIDLGLGLEGPGLGLVSPSLGLGGPGLGLEGPGLGLGLGLEDPGLEPITDLHTSLANH